MTQLQNKIRIKDNENDNHDECHPDKAEALRDPAQGL